MAFLVKFFGVFAVVIIAMILTMIGTRMIGHTGFMIGGFHMMWAYLVGAAAFFMGMRLTVK